MLTRKLIGFKISGQKIPQYEFIWKKESASGSNDIFTYRGVEPPRPELLAAAKDAAILAVKMVGLSTTASEAQLSALFYGMTFEYPDNIDGYELRIKSSVEIQFGYVFKFSTPKWKVYYAHSRGEFNNEARDCIHTLMNECWKYIDGERAQTKLAFAETEAAENA